MGDDSIDKCFQDLRTAGCVEIILKEDARIDEQHFIACNHDGQKPPRALRGYVRRLNHEMVGLHLSKQSRFFDPLDYVIALDAIAKYSILEKAQGF